MLVLGRGVDCCDSWASFADRAVVIASASAQVAGDSFFLLFVPSPAPALINILLLAGAHPCTHSPKLLIPPKFETASECNWIHTWLLADQQCLELAHLCHVGYFVTFQIVAQYQNPRHHHYTCACVQHVQSTHHTTELCFFCGCLNNDHSSSRLSEVRMHATMAP